MEELKRRNKLKYVTKVQGPTLKSIMDKVRSNQENITELDFSLLAKKNKKLFAEGGILVARVLQTNTTVHTLLLQDHEIGDRGAFAMANMLKWNSTLKHIDFYGNEITDAGAEALANALYGHESLEHLALWSNRITDVGATSIAKALQSNTSLTYLGLVHNQITEQGAVALLEAVKNNRSLQTLNLASNRRVPTTITSKISVALATNRMRSFGIVKDDNLDSPIIAGRKETPDIDEDTSDSEEEEDLIAKDTFDEWI